MPFRLTPVEGNPFETAKPVTGGFKLTPVDGNPFADQSRTLGGTAADVGLSAAKGVVGAGEALVGVADILSGGAAGNMLSKIGYDPKTTKQFLDSYYSPAQKEANRKVEDAKGFIGTTKEMIRNPATIGHSVVESFPAMLGGAGVARGLVTKGIPALAAAATGEGVVGAGMAAEQTRQATGGLDDAQAARAIGSGAGTAALALVGGRIAQKLGVGDIDTMLAVAGRNVTQKGITRRIIEGGITEGVFEELPQSIQEQIWMNSALGKPLMEGVPKAGAQGMLAGVGMGGGANVFTTTRQDSPKMVEKEIALKNEPQKAVAPEAPVAVQEKPAQEQPPTAQAVTPQYVPVQGYDKPLSPMDEGMDKARSRLMDQLGQEKAVDGPPRATQRDIELAQAAGISGDEIYNRQPDTDIKPEVLRRKRSIREAEQDISDLSREIDKIKNITDKVITARRKLLEKERRTLEDKVEIDQVEIARMTGQEIPMRDRGPDEVRRGLRDAREAESVLLQAGHLDSGQTRQAPYRLTPVDGNPFAVEAEPAPSSPPAVAGEAKPTVQQPLTVEPPAVAPVEAVPADGKVKEPWQMTKEEYARGAKVRRDMERNYVITTGPNGSEIITRTLEPGQPKERLIEGAHRFEVAEAIRAGKQVPAEVLASYPDLAPKPAPESVAQTAPVEQVGAVPAEGASVPGEGAVTPSLISRKERIEKKIKQLDDVISMSEKTDIPGTYMTGGSGVPTSRIRKINQQLDTRIERAKEAIRLKNRLDQVEAKIAYQKGATKRTENDKAVKSYSEKQLESIAVGDLIDVGGNAPLKVIKKNRKSVVTEGGSKWVHSEIAQVIKKNQEQYKTATPQQAAKAHNVKYDGEQELPGKPAMLQFTDQETGGTFLVNDVSEIPGKLAEIRKRKKPDLSRLTKEDIKAAMPWAASVRQRKTDGVWIVESRNGRVVRIKEVEQIAVDKASFKIAHGRAPGPGESFALGSYVDGEIKLAKIGDKWTLSHESFHFLRDLGVITALDIRAIDKAIGKENITDEDRANWYEAQQKKRGSYNRLQRIVQKIADFIDGWVNLFHRTARGVVRDIESGKVMDRTGGVNEFAQPVSYSIKKAIQSILDNPAFRKWFGESKVVDESGKPLVVYHGTNSEFTEFDLSKSGTRMTWPSAAMGFFFSPKDWASKTYGDKTVHAYLKLEKPFRMGYYQNASIKSKESAVDWRESLEKMGYDGVIIGDGQEFVAFYPTQIKSIYNVGTFDPENPDIRYEVRAFHGSPHAFDKFDTGKIGTGEGAQAFGHGLYFTSEREIARYYADALTTNYEKTWKDFSEKHPEAAAAFSEDIANASTSGLKILDSTLGIELENFYRSGGTYTKHIGDDTVAMLNKAAEDGYVLPKGRRNLYTVTLHKGKSPGEYNWLEWDKPIGEQSGSVKDIWRNIKPEDLGLKVTKEPDGKYVLIDDKKIARSALYDSEEELRDWWYVRPTGGRFYENVISNILGSPKEASIFLLRAGIDGIKYPAGSLSGIKEEGSNYVVFDASAVTVEQHEQYKVKDIADAAERAIKRIKSSRYFFKSTGIQLPTNDPEDLMKGIRWLQTQADLAKNYPAMSQLLDVQTKRQARANDMSIKDRDTTELYYHLPKEGMVRVNQALLRGDAEGVNRYTNEDLKNLFGLSVDEAKGYHSVRNALGQKMDAIVRQMLQHALSDKSAEFNDEMVKVVKRNIQKAERNQLLLDLGVHRDDMEKISWIADWVSERRGYVPHKWGSEWVVWVDLGDDNKHMLEVPSFRSKLSPTKQMRRSAANTRANEVLKEKLKLSDAKIEQLAKTGGIKLVRRRQLPADLFGGARMDVMMSIVESATSKAWEDFRQGLPGDKVNEFASIREKLKETIEELYLSKGWGQHLIGRKGVKGYREDLHNVIAEYLTGFNSFVAKGDAAKEFAAVVEKIDPRETPVMWKHAKEYVFDMLGDTSEAGWFKKIAGTYFLAADLSAAALNMTQNWTHAAGMLRKIEPKTRRITAERELSVAMRDIGREYTDSIKNKRRLFSKAGVLADDEVEAIKRAYDEGHLDPAFFGETTGLHTNRVWENYGKRAFGWLFKLFTGAEGWNRTSTFLAAYRRAKRAEVDPFKAAIETVNESHFIYGRGNRPQLIRKTGALGNVAFTFMTYPMNNLVFIKHRIEELLTAVHNGDKKAVKTSMKVIGSNLGYLFAFGGLMGLPFWGLGAAVLNMFTDDDDDWELLVRRHTPKVLGRAVTRGIPAALLGNDMSWRVQGTDVVGLPIGFQIVEMGYKRAIKAGELWNQGEEVDAFFHIMPDIVRNPYRAVMGYTEGGTRKGVPPIQYTAGEAVTKALGFTPTRESETWTAHGFARDRRERRLQALERFAEQLIQAQRKNDNESLEELKNEVMEYNERQRSKGGRGILLPWKDVVRSAKVRMKGRGKGLDESMPKYMRPYQKEVQTAFGLGEE